MQECDLPHPAKIIHCIAGSPVIGIQFADRTHGLPGNLGRRISVTQQAGTRADEDGLIIFQLLTDDVNGWLQGFPFDMRLPVGFQLGNLCISKRFIGG